MLLSYHDILERIDEPPLWWMNGVPRYESFDPAWLSGFSAEALLVESACQHCRQHFLIGVSSPLNRPEYRASLQQRRVIDLDDPPIQDCPGPGNSMSSIPVRVLEFWEKVNVLTCPTWERVPTLELEFPDN